MSIYGEALKHTESPIERRLLWAMLDQLGYRALLEPNRHVDDLQTVYDLLQFKSQVVIVAPQALFCGYRVDFALFGLNNDDRPVTQIIECDGKDFHTKDWQIERDEKRDRFMVQWGARVARFTGREIMKYPIGCAFSALAPYQGKNWSNVDSRRVALSKFGFEDDRGDWYPELEDRGEWWDVEPARELMEVH
jgi:very-short-patch-repair endonuclease